MLHYPVCSSKLFLVALSSGESQAEAICGNCGYQSGAMYGDAAEGLVNNYIDEAHERKCVTGE